MNSCVCPNKLRGSDLTFALLSPGGGHVRGDFDGNDPPWYVRACACVGGGRRPDRATPERRSLLDFWIN